MVRTPYILKIYLIIFLLLPITIKSAEDKTATKDDLVINVYQSLSIGELIKGTVKRNFYEPQVIKFEVITKKPCYIRVTKKADISNQYIEAKSIWRAGPITGLEKEFNGFDQYYVEDNKFYITVTIESIEALQTTPNGHISINPEIEVECIEN